jgi:hypothetical protein
VVFDISITPELDAGRYVGLRRFSRRSPALVLVKIEAGKRRESRLDERAESALPGFISF